MHTALYVGKLNLSTIGIYLDVTNIQETFQVILKVSNSKCYHMFYIVNFYNSVKDIIVSM